MRNNQGERIEKAWWSLSLALAIGWVSTAQSGPVIFQGPNGTFSVSVKSLSEKRWDTVLRQKYDYSCGSAAIATLLTYHYEIPIAEDVVFKSMFAAGDQQQIRRVGFSLLDMKRFLDGKGLQSDGFRMTLDKFASIGVPGITLINTNGYKHFVVVKGIEGDRVLIGDPALGTRIVRRGQFEKQWNGAVLAARGEFMTARQHFNEERDWQVRPQAPIGEGVARNGLGTFTLTLPLTLPGRVEFGR